MFALLFLSILESICVWVQHVRTTLCSMFSPFFLSFLESFCVQHVQYKSDSWLCHRPACSQFDRFNETFFNFHSFLVCLPAAAMHIVQPFLWADEKRNEAHKSVQPNLGHKFTRLKAWIRRKKISLLLSTDKHRNSPFRIYGSYGCALKLKISIRKFHLGTRLNDEYEWPML